MPPHRLRFVSGCFLTKVWLLNGPCVTLFYRQQDNISVGPLISARSETWLEDIHGYSSEGTDIDIYLYTAVADTHAPGRDQEAKGLRRWLRDIITAVSCCRGWKGQNNAKWWKSWRHTRSGQTHNTDATGLTAANNWRKQNISQPGTWYARSIYPQINNCNIYKVHFQKNITDSEVIQNNSRFCFTLLVHQAWFI